jgi:hypothetical protein
MLQCLSINFRKEKIHIFDTGLSNREMESLSCYSTYHFLNLPTKSINIEFKKLVATYSGIKRKELDKIKEKQSDITPTNWYFEEKFKF